MSVNSDKKFCSQLVIFLMSLIASVFLGFFLSHWSVVLGVLAGLLLFGTAMYIAVKNPNSFFEKW